MSIITSSKTQTSYDVNVVGSGAGGGLTACICAMPRAKVLIMKAGRTYDPVRETPMFQIDGQATLRPADITDKQVGFHDATIDGGWQIQWEPYSKASSGPAKKFWWPHPRMFGGRTNHWGQVALRNGPYDFKPDSRDGLGFDWPISYEEVAPCYDKVEILIGVFGTNEGLENTPVSPHGVLLPPPKARAGKRLAQRHAKKRGVPIVPTHSANLTMRQNADTLPARIHPNDPPAQRILAVSMRQRAACFWATHCGRGCAIKANYQSTTVHPPQALVTGNLDIFPNAIIRQVNPYESGNATGVSYIDKTTGREFIVKSRVVVLASGSAESMRILLNSKSACFPEGLGNSSGKVGKYIMDTVGEGLGGQIAALDDMPLHNEEDTGGAHMYVPWWPYKKQDPGKFDSSRGYHGGRVIHEVGGTNMGANAKEFGNQSLESNVGREKCLR